MRFAGRLEELDLAALLQTLALKASTGRLTLTRPDGYALILLRAGRIIYATLSSARETFGNLLRGRGLLSEAELLAALERQASSAEPASLGAVLVEMGTLEEATLRHVLRQHAGALVRQLLGWKNGFFKFEPVELGPGEAMEVDVGDWLVSDGFPPQEVLMQALAGGSPASPSEPSAPGTSEEPLVLPGLALESMVSGAWSPAFAAETVLKLMRYAAQILNRGVLFLVQPGEVQGIGAFGINLPGRVAAEQVRETIIPLREPSVFRVVIGRRRTYLGPLEPTRWNLHLVERLGGQQPEQVVAVPMVARGVVKLILYGDNLPEGREIGPIDALEFQVAEAARALEESIAARKPPG